MSKLYPGFVDCGNCRIKASSITEWGRCGGESKTESWISTTTGTRIVPVGYDKLSLNITEALAEDGIAEIQRRTVGSKSG